jgi:hypothetical protein
MTGSQQPIFQRNPELAIAAFTHVPEACSEKPCFVPLGIFVARRDSFDFILRERRASKHEAVRAAFTELPMDENGWCETTAKIARIGTSEDGFPIWRLERG